MENGIFIREARAEDCVRIKELNRDALGYDYPVDKTERNLRLLLLKSSEKIYVAESGGFVLGYIHATDYESTYHEGLKNIMALAVDEKYRGLGVGRKLLLAAEDWARSQGNSGVRLISSFPRTEAHKFYLRCGYMLRKEHKNFIKLFE